MGVFWTLFFLETYDSGRIRYSTKPTFQIQVSGKLRGVDHRVPRVEILNFPERQCPTRKRRPRSHLEVSVFSASSRGCSLESVWDGWGSQAIAGIAFAEHFRRCLCITRKCEALPFFSRHCSDFWALPELLKFLPRSRYLEYQNFEAPLIMYVYVHECEPLANKYPSIWAISP